MSMSLLIINGSSTEIEDGLSFRDTVVSAARDAGFGKFRVLLNDIEIDPIDAPDVIETNMTLEIRPYEVAGDCSGGYCSNQCTSNTCTGNIAANEVWDYSTDEPFPDGVGNDTIHDENVERLRASINDERVRRSLYPGWSYPAWTFSPTLTGSDEGGTSVIIGQDASATNEALRQCKDAINNMSAGLITVSFNDGSDVRSYHLRQMRDRLDNLRAECLCNGNCASRTYCSCKGDCGCDYSCSFNWSDERVKYDIKAI